jgi:hypothetical protein
MGPLATTSLLIGSMNGGPPGGVQGAAFGKYAVVLVNDITSGPVKAVRFTIPGAATVRIVTGLIPGPGTPRRSRL